jgi:hypothetical protein
MVILRAIYLIAVLLGLWINFQEYRHAKWVQREVWRLQLSAIRQLVAKTFLSEELMRVWVQALLVIPSVVGLIMPFMLSDESGAMLARALYEVRSIVAASICAHIAVAIILAAKSVKHRRARHAVLTASTPYIGGDAA